MTLVTDLFEVRAGNKFDRNKLTESETSSVPLVGRSALRQGVSTTVDVVDGVIPFPTGCVTVALGGSILASFVQDKPFYTGQNVAVLIPLDPSMIALERLFYASAIEHNKFRYTAFGREANRTLATLELPDSIPAWVYETPIPDVSTMAAPAGVPVELTGSDGWGEFRIDALFEAASGGFTPGRDDAFGPTPVISSRSASNGVSASVGVESAWPAGVITVASTGSIGEAFYQDRPCVVTGNVNVLVPIHDVGPSSVEAGLFVATILRQKKPHFSYGRTWSLGKLKESVIRLPKTPDGDPDWTYMESYVKGLGMSSVFSEASAV